MGTETARLEPTEPTFKKSLYKLKENGDQSQEQDWVMRDWWISKRNLVYYSKKEGSNMIYLREEDLATAVVEIVTLDVPTPDCMKPWVLSVSSAGVETAFFAAPSMEEQAQWLKCFQEAGAGGSR